MKKKICMLGLAMSLSMLGLAACGENVEEPAESAPVESVAGAPEEAPAENSGDIVPGEGEEGEAPVGEGEESQADNNETEASAEETETSMGEGTTAAE